MPHLRIERADENGSKRITTYDRVFVVDDDDREIDISSMTKGWTLSARAGEVENVTLYVLGARVVENAGLIPEPPSPARETR